MYAELINLNCVLQSQRSKQKDNPISNHSLEKISISYIPARKNTVKIIL